MPANPDYPELAAGKADWRYQPDAACLQDQVILITGAGDGIGRAAARTFALLAAAGAAAETAAIARAFAILAAAVAAAAEFDTFHAGDATLGAA